VGQSNSRTRETIVPIRPEAEQKLRAGFQRRADQQAERYAASLAHAEELAVRLGYGPVTGVFSGQAGGGVKRGAYLVGLLPLAAIPLLIADAAVGLPGVVPLLAASPFIIGAWFGLTLFRWREPKRRVWWYAFTDGFAFIDDPRADAVTIRWNDITDIGQIWTDHYDPSSEKTTPMLTGYRLACADGRSCAIDRSLRNVRDPYPGVGRPLQGLMPASVAATMPTYPTVDEVIAAALGR
jgi:hypothetical protein